MLCKSGVSLKSNPDNSRTAAAPTQQIGRNFENSQLFVSTVSIKASQNSTSKNCFDLNTRKNASETKIYENVLKSEESGHKSERSLFEDSKPEVGGWQEPKFVTPSPKQLDRKCLKTPMLKGRKLLMDGKDDENSSIRTPLEILKDVFADKDLSENLSEDLQNLLRAKAAQLKEVSPACNCAALGLKGFILLENLQKIEFFSSVDDNGPFYTQLGFSSTLTGLKQLFVDRLGAKEGEVRLDLKFWHRLDLNMFVFR